MPLSSPLHAAATLITPITISLLFISSGHFADFSPLSITIALITLLMLSRLLPTLLRCATLMLIIYCLID